MSKKVAIITDSSSTIRANEIDHVFVLPLSIVVDDEKVYQDDSDANSKEILNLLGSTSKFTFRQSKLPNIKTSMPSPKAFIDVVEKIAKDYDFVICLPVSSGLSGVYGQWNNLLKTPRLAVYKNVFVYETSDISISLKWLVEDVLKMASQVKDIDEVKKFVEAWMKRIDCVVVLDNLKQLVAGGRVKKIQAMLTSLLKVKPVIRFHHKNEFLFRTFSIASAIEKGFLRLISDLRIKNFDEVERIGFTSNFVQPETSKKIMSDIIEYAKNFFKKQQQNIKDKFSTALVPAIISAHTGIDSFSIQMLKK